MDAFSPRDAVHLSLFNKMFVSLTFTFEPLPDEAPQHLSTVVAEGGGLVGVDIKSVGSDLEVLNCGLS